jgi:hypothetical protein
MRAGCCTISVDAQEEQEEPEGRQWSLKAFGAAHFLVLYLPGPPGFLPGSSGAH